MDSYGVTLLLVSTAFAGIYFLGLPNPYTLLELFVKFILLLGVATFFIQNGASWLKKWQQSKRNSENSDIDPNKYESKERRYKEKIQEEHLKKTESYKTRILIPREEKKEKMKEEEFLRFQGPAWKGEGHELGGSRQSRDGTSEDAARNRILPENINQDAAERARQKINQRRKKHTIELPEEPEEENPNCTTVCLRTPLGLKQRRFDRENTIQNVLDYMTSLGFSQRHYTVSTSYPRQSLQEQRETTLGEMGFYSKIVLNVEEIE